MKKLGLYLLTLVSAFSLVACGQSKSANTTTSSTKEKTSQSSSVTKSKTKASSVTESSQVQESSSKDTSASSSKEQKSEPEAKKEESKTTSKDVSDISNFAGTWANDRGESVAIQPDGSVVITRPDGTSFDMALHYNQDTNGVGNYTIYSPTAPAGAAGFLYIPAGVENDYIAVDNQDTLLIGQDASAGQHPYYRQ